MKNLLKKYYKMTENEKREIEDLYLLHELEVQLNNCKTLDLTMAEEQELFAVIKETLKYSNINCKELIKRVIEMLQCVDITVSDIKELENDELLELLTKCENDFKNIKVGPDIVTAFLYGNFYCVLLKEREEYMLVYERNDGTQYIDKFGELKEIIKYVIKNKLMSRGENVV